MITKNLLKTLVYAENTFILRSSDNALSSGNTLHIIWHQSSQNLPIIMPDQPKKGTGSKGEATRPVNGKSSGSGGNSSTQATSSAGGNAQATSGQPEPFTIGRYNSQTPDHEPPILIKMPGRKSRTCPKELSDKMDKDMQELEDKNQPDNKDESKGNGKGKNVEK
ncbi:hypothetical protein FMUND_2447 [Fusarium mundagurra]|uniref:Uncharacterized protein n=1 Tax=Fusarium mundagurra TaxID=1567541 RepID=A0A8H5Z1C0_9HYPO|nr:hypothetical protein FMUND_2447 [Fusarium mundagurra]